MKRTIIAFLAVLFMHAGPAFAGSDVHWGYTGHGGPEHWGGLSHKFALCSSGKNQSPIDLTGMVSSRLQPLKLNYTAVPLSVVNNGHTIQVNYVDGGTLEADGAMFNLLQVHFHTPSENHINGKSFPMEAHLVHADKEGNLAVIAVMFVKGRANAFVENVWEHMPALAGEEALSPDVTVNINDMLPRSRDYYRFNGSLTTPPCSEGVRWYVLKTPMYIAADQVKQFSGTMGGDTNRPVQPHYARPVLQ